MAELFGLAVSAITVAEVTGSLCTSILTLRRLWNEVKDVPEDINTTMEELELLSPILAEMEIEFSRPTCSVHHSSLATLSMRHCNRVLNDLRTLVEDLQGQILSQTKMKRNFAKVKVSIKKDILRKFQGKLQRALQILNVSQQAYLIVCARQLTEFSSSIRTNAAVSNSPKSQNPSLVVCEDSVGKSGSSLKLQSVPWNRWLPNRIFSSRIGLGVVKQDNRATSSTVFQARIQLPTLISHKAWDFLAYNAYNEWKFRIRSWNMRPHQTTVFYYASRGMFDEICGEVGSGRASFYDRDPDGWTLLHHAAFEGHLDTVRNLMQVGLDLNEGDNIDATPLYNMCRGSTDPGNIVSLFRFLHSNDHLADAINDLLSPNCMGRRQSSLHRHIWTVPDLFQLFAREYTSDISQLSLGPWFFSLVWDYVDPQVLLTLLKRYQHVCEEDLKSALENAMDSSIHGFARAYFAHYLRTEEQSLVREEVTNLRYDFNHWRKLARWIFAGIFRCEISRTGDRLWEYTTPLFLGLLSCEWNIPSTYRDRRLAFRRLSGALTMWLEDVALSGMNLVTYGRYEYALFMSNTLLREWRWDMLGLRDTSTYLSGPRLSSFTYGPLPEDWNFVWDQESEDYLLDFWNIVYNPPYFIPGEWSDSA